MNRFQPRISMLFVPAALLMGLCLVGAAPSARADTAPCANPGGTGGCSSTIQAAIDAAKPGDTVSVGAGTYKESVTITKAITLQGAGGGATIIDATGKDHAIMMQGVTGPATISGIAAENANLAGINLRDSSQIMLTGNLVQGNDKNVGPEAPPGQGVCPGSAPFDGDDCGEAIHLQGVSDSVISNNTVQQNVGGILVTDETGPTHDNLIINN
jgi:parallel beta-helix repeat protein